MTYKGRCLRFCIHLSLRSFIADTFLPLETEPSPVYTDTPLSGHLTSVLVFGVMNRLVEQVIKLEESYV